MALFSNMNKAPLFTNFDASVIANKDKDDRYISCENLYKKNGPDKVYTFHAAYINKADGEHEGSRFAEETAVVALDDIYVNVPQHQLQDVKDILASTEMINAINRNRAGFKVVTYTMRNYPGETFYKIHWLDLK